MTKLLKESLFEDEQENLKSAVNINDEMNYFVDMEIAYSKDPETLKQFLEAFKEFGIDKNKVGVLSSFGTSETWDVLKNELDRMQLEYYDFETNDNESIIIFNIDDLESEKNEKDFK
jgi:hypothetical protein